MCTEQDKEFFNKCNNAPNIDQIMRLICVCLALDFKAAIFSLFAFAETLKKNLIRVHTITGTRLQNRNGLG